MSRYFQVGERVLWNPSNGVAELFVTTAEALVPFAGRSTGIGPMVDDEYEVDPVMLSAYVDELVGRYRSSTHRILRSLGCRQEMCHQPRTSVFGQVSGKVRT
ncbi:DUF6086 family protein [Micromonospora sp. NPDC050200]|uniref:DUF6086 family protein n=1 Tax=Micromonospora sp. NPDC050200 TaxID=3155664 RepID=UPI0033D23C07